MTREKIINEIKPILDELSYPDAVSYLTQNDVKWLNEIIKKLEQKPCEDAVSRQSVLNKKELVELEDGQSFYCISPEDVEMLPSVAPIRKKGKWICVHHIENKITYDSWKCSECQFDFNSEEESMVNFDEYNYCPNCGAKMIMR